MGSLLTAFLMACGGVTESPRGLDAREAAAISDSVAALVSAWQQAVEALDTTDLARFYLADTTFRWIEDGQILYATPSQLLQAWRSTVPAVKEMALILDQTRITPLAPGVALVTTSFIQRVTDTASRQGGFAGATSLIVVDTPNGWRFLTGHTSAAGGPAARP